MNKFGFTKPHAPTLIFLLIAFFILPLFNAEAQHTCGTDQVNAHMWAKHPALQRLHEQMETRIRAEMNEHLERKRRDPNYIPVASRAVTTIPVVFHIMHNIGDAVGVGTNISQTRIQQEIDSLNACFRNTFGYAGGPDHSNAGISSTDVMIEFCLATQDPLGFPTTGVTRQPFSSGSPLYYEDPGFDFGSTLDRDMKHIDNWPSDQYFNVWVVDDICDVSGGGGSCGTAAYAFFPSAHGQYYDGAVVEDNYVGTSSSNTKILAHEIGHYLGLYHTFEGGCTNGDCTTDGDQICDTPPDNSTANVSCSTSGTDNSCTTDADDGSVNNPFSSDVEDIYEAYMDYGFQSCQNTWTPLQSVRMNSALSTERASLHNMSNVSCATPTVLTTQVAFSMAGRTAAEYEQTTTADCRGNHRDIYVRVQMSQDPGSNVTLTFTKSGTATEGIDYDLQTPTATFTTGGELYAHAQVRIYDDAAVEGNETLILGYTISGSASAAASQQTITITIKDDDTTPTGPGNFVFYEDFEAGGSLSSLGWSISCFSCGGFSSNDTNVWINGNSGGMSGTYSAYVSLDPANQTYSYGKSNVSGMAVTNPLAITSLINASSFSDLTLSFDYKSNGQTNLDYGLIYYRFGTSGSFTQLSGAGPFQGVSSSTNFSLALPSSFNNQSFQLAFLWINNYDGTGSDPPFTIDNFGISTPSTNVEEDVNMGVPSQDDEKYLAPMSTVYFYDQVSGDLMVKIENTSNYDFGCTTVSIERSSASAGSSTVAFWNTSTSDHLASKTFLVSPTNNQIGQSYNITLYYTQTEIDDYLTATGKTVADIKMVKYSGQISSVSPPVNATIVSNTEIKNYNGSLATPNFGTAAYAIEATFLNGFSGFGIGDPGTPFPIELLSFTAEPIGSHVALEWVTEREFNNDYFLLEKSSDRTIFQTVSKIEGNGTTGSKSIYQHMDTRPFPGVSYYRLKQFDFDGSFEYSPIVEVHFENNGVHRVYPNPFDNMLTVELATNRKGTPVLTLFSTLGKKVFSKQLPFGQQSQYFIPVAGLPSGIYLYEINDELTTQRGKLIK